MALLLRACARSFVALALSSLAPFAAAQQLSISDASVTEGNVGTKAMTFTISLSAPSAALTRVDVNTANGSATAGSDYGATSNLGFRIPAGATSKTFTVTILGDTTAEPDESFSVNLSNAIGATIADAQGIGTIVNDDAAVTPALSIADAYITEGDAGTKWMAFTISVSTPPSTTVTFDVAPSDLTASAPSDYASAAPSSMSIPAGGFMTSYFVQVQGDTAIEPDEQFLVTVSNVQGAVAGDLQATGTIGNDDVPPALYILDQEVVEGDSGTKAVTFTVQMSRTWDSDVGFDVATSDDSASAGSDYVALAPVHGVIPAGQTSKEFTVLVNGDTQVEPIEYFNFTMSNVTGGATVQDGSAVAAILNDDIPTMSIGDVTIGEGDSGSTNATFTVSLSAPAPVQVPFDIWSSDLTAQAGSDYGSIGTNWAIPVGESSQTFTVPIYGDKVFEADETFAVHVANAVNATIVDGDAIGTISNDDQPPPELSIADVSVSEGNSGTKLATFTVSLNKPAIEAVSFNIGTTWHPGQTAEAGSDFDSHFGFITIPVGGTSATFDVTIKGDTDFESDEFFQVDVDSVLGATVVDGLADGTITNDDPRPTPNIAVGDVEIYEGDAGTKIASFLVLTNIPSVDPITFDFATGGFLNNPGDATPGVDYVAKSVTGLSIPAGQTSTYVDVVINGDTTEEDNERFNATISNVVGANVTHGTGQGTILNDDQDTPWLSVGNATITEGDTGTKTATVTVSLNKAIALDVSYDIATFDNTATAGSDYVSKTLTGEVIPAGQTSRTFSFEIVGDTAVEADETVRAQVYNLWHANASQNTGYVTISNDDFADAPKLSIADVAVTEGNSGTKTATFTVQLSSAAATAVSFDIATANGTATAGTDYVALALTGQQIPAGQTSKTFSVTVKGDTTVEPTETYFVNLSNPSGATIADGQALGTITDDDTPPALSIADASITEGNAGTKTLNFTVSLSFAAAGTVSFNLATANGTATAGSDYAALSLTGQTIAAGATSKSFSVTINGDTAIESDETFVLGLSNASGASIADGSATGMIVNDDATLSIADVSVAEANFDAWGLVFTISLSVPSSSDVSFDFATADGTATAGSDYVAKSLTGLVIPAGQTSTTAFVPVKGDAVIEPDETVLATVSNVVGAVLADGSAVGTITNDDLPSSPVISIGDVNIAEGNSGSKFATVTVSLSAPSAASVMFDIATADGTATAGSDYTAFSQAGYNLNPGETSKTFNIAISGDTAIEPDESFTVDLKTIIGATVVDPSATVIIANDDAGAQSTLSVADAGVMEGAKPGVQLLFKVSLSHPADAPVSFNATTAAATATAPGDFTQTSFNNVVIPTGATSVVLKVPVLSDAVTEADEYMTLSLSNVSGAIPGDVDAYGRIYNDDGTELINVPADPSIGWANGDDGASAISADGRFVVFNSNGTNLLSGPGGYLYVRDTLTGDTEQVDVALDGTKPNDFPRLAAISADGRYVVFDSAASNLVANDTNSLTDVFVRDRKTKVTSLVSVASNGGGSNGFAKAPAISADGRYVAFYSEATNLVASATNSNYNVYVRDLVAGVTTRVSDKSDGTGGGGANPVISGDGRYVAFESNVPLLPGDNGMQTVYRRDRSTGALERVSQSTGGGASNSNSMYATISSDGSKVAFVSWASDLVGGDSNNGGDIFVRNMVSGTTVMASLNSSGGLIGGGVDSDAPRPMISADGRYVAFESPKSDVVPGDTNGKRDIFLRDLVGQTTTRVVMRVDGGQPTGDSRSPMISGHGERIAFNSMSTGLVIGDPDDLSDVFLVRGASALPANADLAGLAVDSGTLSPAFSPSVTSYTTTTPAASIRFTATTSDSLATLAIDGNPQASGVISPAFALLPGENVFPIVVTAQDRSTSQTVLVTVTRDSSVPLPSLSIGDVSVSEGNSGTKTATFTVSLSSSAPWVVSFDATTANGTATAGSDFVALALAGQQIAAGQTSKTVSVTINGDTSFESDESFTLGITNVSGATVADGSATGTITNDDPAPPSLSIGDVSIAEGNSGTKTATFTVSLSGAAPSTVSFDVATANGTATSGSDFVALALNGQQIAAGQSSKTVSVTINGDTAVEPDETFNVNVSNVSGATVADASALGTITNDDSGGGGPTLSIGDVTVTEGNSLTKTATFTITLSAAQSGPVLVDVATANGTATAGSDYVAKSTVGLRMAAGTTSKTFAVTINGDTASEPDETFTVNLSNASGATIADGQALGTITNDDAAATPTLSIADASVSEGNSGTKTLTFTVSLSPAAAGTVTYNIATSNGTATSGSDYVASSLTGQSIAAGTTSKTFAVTINGDTSTESDETFNVTLSSVSGATLGDGTAVGTITNDDGASGPTLSIGDVSVAEGNSLSKQVTFTVTLSAAAAGTVTYNIATADGTAIAPTDYTAKSLTGQSIAAGTTSKTFTVAVKGDKTVEPNETFLVNVTSVSGATLADGQATGTITNDDAAALTIARFDAKGIVDDVDDGNRQPQIAPREYATLLADSASTMCRRAPNATVIAIEGVEHKQVLADLAEAANAICASKPAYTAVMADADSRGFLIATPAKGEVGTTVLAQPEVNAAAKSTTLTIQGAGHATPVTIMLAAGTGKALAMQLTQRTRSNPGEAIVLLGANQAKGFVDLTAREFGKALPTERLLVSPALLGAYAKPGLELPALPANEAPAQLLKLQ